MKKIRICGLILLLSLLLQAFILQAAAENDLSVTQGCHSVDAVRPLAGTDKLLDTARAAILFERSSDTLVYAYNADQMIDPSSMAKLMTALIALEECNVDEYVTVSRDALDAVGIGVVTVKPRLEAGEDVTVKDLLYCMVAASDNDAPAVLAEHIAGGQNAFVQMMNERARQMGCTSTNFANAHGLPADDAYSTARDLCRILDAALDNAAFMEIFSAKTYTVPATNRNEARQILTTNYMMSKDYTSRYFDDRVTGGKTGTDGDDGRCLAVTAQTNDMELIGIVMGAKPVHNADNPNILDKYGSFEEMVTLLDYASSNYTCRQVFYEGQTFSQYPVSGGSNHAVATPAIAVSAVLPIKLDKTLLRYELGNAVSLTAPVEAGQRLSWVEAWYGDLCIARTELVAMRDVGIYVAPTEPETPDHHEEEQGAAVLAIILGIVLGIIVLAVLILFVIRWGRMAAAHRRRRNRRRRR